MSASQKEPSRESFRELVERLQNEKGRLQKRLEIAEKGLEAIEALEMGYPAIDEVQIGDRAVHLAKVALALLYFSARPTARRSR